MGGGFSSYCHVMTNHLEPTGPLPVRDWKLAAVFPGCIAGFSVFLQQYIYLRRAGKWKGQQEGEVQSL